MSWGEALLFHFTKKLLEQMLSSVGLLHTRFVIILNTLFINPWDEERYGVALKKRIMLTLNWAKIKIYET